MGKGIIRPDSRQPVDRLGSGQAVARSGNIGRDGQEPQKIKVPALELELSNLSSEISSLAEVLGDLNDRIKPITVMTPADSSAGGGMSGEDSGQCTLILELRRIRGMVTANRNFAQDMLSRISI